jgi:hypothetical protein
MGLVQKFGKAETDSDWVFVDMDLPETANRNYIRNELGYMAEDYVTQIGYNETDGGLQLGFRPEAERDQILDHLTPVIEKSVGMSSKDSLSLWKVWSREGGLPSKKWPMF